MRRFFLGGSLLSSLIVFGFIFWILGGLFIKAWPHLSWEFLISDPEEGGRSGGVFPIIISTLYLVVIALTAVMPLSLLVAFYIYIGKQNQSTQAIYLQSVLDVLASVPSVVFGLFGHAFFSVILGMGFSLMSGGLTLACMIMPAVVRALIIGLESVPSEMYKASLAMGLSHRAILLKVFFPASFSSLLLGIVLGVSRSLAETAALLFTSGYVDRLPSSVMDSGRSLSVHIYELAMNVPGGDTSAYTSGLVLILILLSINTLSLVLGDWWARRRCISYE